MIFRLSCIARLPTAQAEYSKSGAKGGQHRRWGADFSGGPIAAAKSLRTHRFDHYHEYTRAVQRENTKDRQAAEYFRDIERMGQVVKRASPHGEEKRPSVGSGL